MTVQSNRYYSGPWVSWIFIYNRLTIMHYLAKCSDLEWPARDLFKAIGDGVIKANINYE